MKNTTNVFQGGLSTDLHPLSTSQQQLTDALNATMITFNGNEMMLQNDMGNTLIQDSATGNIMGLTPGFIPTGLKEHGGIMYITSVNKDGVGEIGTIPSPIIRDYYKGKKSLVWQDQPIPAYYSDITCQPIQISNKFYPGDKFLINLNLSIAKDDIKGGVLYHALTGNTIDSGNTIDPADYIIERKVLKHDKNGYMKESYPYSIQNPIISYSSDVAGYEDTEDTKFNKTGIYTATLFSTYGSNTTLISGNVLDSQQIDEDTRNNYWFTHEDNITFPKDLMECTLSGTLKPFVNNYKPGYLSVALQVQDIEEFGMLKRKNAPVLTPYTRKAYNNNNFEYLVFFPGFWYKTTSGVYVSKIKCKVVDEETQKMVPLVSYSTNGETKKSEELLTISFADHQAENVSFDIPNHNNWSKDEIYIPHTDNGYAQVQNTEAGYRDVYFLTNQSKLVYKKETDFESSTQVVSSDNDAIESDKKNKYTGLFYANIGQDNNKWFELSVDYYDQYDSKLGTYTLRFNPYLNDVFGSNVSLSGIEKGQKLVMGKQDDVITQIGVFDNKVSFETKYTYQFPYSFPMDECETWACDGPLSESVMEENIHFKADGSLNISVPYTENNQNRVDSVKTSIVYLYAFKPINPEDCVLISPVFMGENLEQNNSIQFDMFLTHLEPKIENRDRNYIMFGGDVNKYGLYGHPMYFTDLKIENFNDEEIALKANNLDKWFIPGPYISTPINSYVEAYDFRQRYPYKYKCVVDSVSLTENSLNIIVNPEVEILYANRSPLFSDLEPYRGTQISNLDLGPGLGSIERWAYSRESINYYYLKFKGSGRFHSYLSQDITYNPLYNITPYFTLKGKNDEQQDIYITRWDDLRFEHNFETDKLGEDINFYKDPNDKNKEVDPCSYNLNTPFKYSHYPISADNPNKLQYTDELPAGIYVLNIQRCPKEATWIADINWINEEIYEDSTNCIRANLSIVINGNTYEDIIKDSNGKFIRDNYYIKNLTTDINIYDPEKWHEEFYRGKEGTNKDGETVITKEEYAIDSDNTNIYIPIVLFLKQTSSIQIGFNGSCQDMGLYKIQNVNSEDLSTLKDIFGDKYYNNDFMLYTTYMQSLKSAVKEKYEKPADQYAMLQKFGVFFKEAYVFVDGVIESEDGVDTIRPVQIGEYAAYLPCPYIPSDPSILPCSVDMVKLNMYAMPVDVLNGGEQEFKISPELNDVNTDNILSTSYGLRSYFDLNSWGTNPEPEGGFTPPEVDHETLA